MENLQTDKKVLLIKVMIGGGRFLMDRVNRVRKLFLPQRCCPVVSSRVSKARRRGGFSHVEWNSYCNLLI